MPEDSKPLYHTIDSEGNTSITQGQEHLWNLNTTDELPALPLSIHMKEQAQLLMKWYNKEVVMPTSFLKTILIRTQPIMCAKLNSDYFKVVCYEQWVDDNYLFYIQLCEGKNG